MFVDSEKKKQKPKAENNLQDEFAKFLVDNIEKKICTQFANSHFYEPPTRNCTLLREFHEITDDQLIRY